VAITPFTHGTWEVLPGGDRLWRLRVSCPGATDINLGFTRFRLPRGATLHLTSETTDYYQGPYTWRDNREHGQFWTPVVPGDLAVLEVYIPADAPFSRIVDDLLLILECAELDDFRDQILYLPL